MPRPNASLVLNGRDRNTPTPRNYNSAVFSQTNQNIVQGQIYSVAVSEVNFPYDIPNIQSGFNYFFLDVNGFIIPGLPLEIVVTPGFYTGTELAVAINAEILAAGAALPTPLIATQMPTIAFDNTTNRFTFTGPTAPLTPQYNNWFLVSPYTFPFGASVTPNNLGKDILSIMGFLQGQGNTFSALAPANTLQAAQAAPLAFTQYIDICSPQLCKFQYFRDGSTTNLARRTDIICRLYIANNVALAVGDVDGTRPFLINRQFQNPRVMRWTADNAIGQIDINLYDDVGQPLLTTWEPRPYQITFLASELEKD